jgi:hypothetical protein
MAFEFVIRCSLIIKRRRPSKLEDTVLRLYLSLASETPGRWQLPSVGQAALAGRLVRPNSHGGSARQPGHGTRVAACA